MIQKACDADDGACSTSKPQYKRACVHAWMIPYLTGIARKHGYALGLHGSMARDLDLIAAPWTDEAVSAGELAEAIREGIDGKIVSTICPNPEPKPHGRLAFRIDFGSYSYIDLSVMPLAQSFTGYSS